MEEKNKGGRPTNEERRRRLLERLENIDLAVAEQALTIAESKNVTPATRVQALQVLVGLKLDSPKGAGTPSEHNVPDDCVALLEELETQFKRLTEKVEADLATLKESAP